eukprot:4645835-Amphidinium_carterae.1
MLKWRHHFPSRTKKPSGTLMWDFDDEEFYSALFDVDEDSAADGVEEKQLSSKGRKHFVKQFQRVWCLTTLQRLLC